MVLETFSLLDTLGIGLTALAFVIIASIQGYRVDDPDSQDGVTPKWAAQDAKRYQPKAVPLLRIAQVVGLLGVGIFLVQMLLA